MKSKLHTGRYLVIFLALLLLILVGCFVANRTIMQYAIQQEAERRSSERAAENSTYAAHFTPDAPAGLTDCLDGLSFK